MKLTSLIILLACHTNPVCQTWAATVTSMYQPELGWTNPSTNKFTNYKFMKMWFLNPEWTAIAGSATIAGYAVDIYSVTNGKIGPYINSWQYTGGGLYGFPICRTPHATTNVFLYFRQRPEPTTVSVAQADLNMKASGMFKMPTKPIRYKDPLPKLSQAWFKPSLNKIATPLAPSPR